jgi:hypothetical protein
VRGLRKQKENLRTELVAGIITDVQSEKSCRREVCAAVRLQTLGSRGALVFEFQPASVCTSDAREEEKSVCSSRKGRLPCMQPPADLTLAVQTRKKEDLLPRSLLNARKSRKKKTGWQSPLRMHER